MFTNYYYIESQVFLLLMKKTQFFLSKLVSFPKFGYPIIFCEDRVSALIGTNVSFHHADPLCL